jgi:hypothetical protein
MALIPLCTTPIAYITRLIAKKRKKTRAETSKRYIDTEKKERDKKVEFREVQRKEEEESI